MNIVKYPYPQPITLTCFGFSYNYREVPLYRSGFGKKGCIVLRNINSVCFIPENLPKNIILKHIATPLHACKGERIY